MATLLAPAAPSFQSKPLIGSPRTEFLEFLAANGLACHAQPITRLCSGRLIGHELLVRGPKGSPWFRPVDMFRQAERLNCLGETDEMSRNVILREGQALSQAGHLFINIHPVAVMMPEGLRSIRPDRLQSLGLSPSQIVLEVAESYAIEDYPAFCRVLQPLRDAGMQLAIDDFGAGYAGLTSLLRLRPEFLKIDKSIISALGRDAFSRDLLASVQDLARTNGIRVVAEGIEAPEQLGILLELGVELGQGYLLGRPAPICDMGHTAQNTVAPIAARTRRQRLGSLVSLRIGEMVEQAAVVEESETCAAVHALFQREPSPTGLVVMSQGRPRGLVMRSSLLLRLSGRYGYSLYEHRPISSVMDSGALIVPPTAPLFEVNERAMRRNAESLYDLVIVADDEELRGVVSVRRLMETTTSIQIKRAQYANPLTGLPGNVVIERELHSFLAEENPFTLLFADLDNFKAYNDLYGFDRGDEMIRLAANQIQEVCAPVGDETLVGHVGGDDFVILTPQLDVSAICRRIEAEFARRVVALFSAQHQESHSFPGKDRDGHPRIYPLTRLTVVAVPVQPGDYQSPDQVAAVAAHQKARTRMLRERPSFSAIESPLALA